ncbi:MAG: monofunctional biosynthetic peptidoglycan transglycosylase [Chitinophagaceae bacterium]|nr:monofunctional biosynthetic peptidoglycan transglycosylase [Bacteroidota bacterium]MCC6257868.1 monofunctional biosynthetic peptidoglycan transglycosylase [Chitinophagaceae bacterium]MCW5916183.1 monofunctional biosynthetic peptidoglycan transglycosylase [Ferruginibacter sp.]
MDSTEQLPKKNKWGRRLFRVFIWMFILQLAYIILTRWINPPITITQAVSVVRGDGLKRDYISFDEMGSAAKLAVIASEDQLFPDHNGFDVKAIKKAIVFNEKHPTRQRGASTISQQTAKNVFLWQHGGFFRKGLEVYFTFMIEKLWNKQRILETYLNVAEMGEGIFGIQAAAKAYFGKDAKNLTNAQAAMIAACLPNPKKFSVKPLSNYVARRSAMILRQMNNLAADSEIQELIR